MDEHLGGEFKDRGGYKETGETLGQRGNKAREGAECFSVPDGRDSGRPTKGTKGAVVADGTEKKILARR